MKVSALIILAVNLAACTPATSTTDASQMASSADSASTLAPTAVLIPEGFIGHWDATAETCKATSDMKLAITQTEMTFWESTGQISAVTVNGPGDITVKAAFSGEGEQWQRDLHMNLDDNGNKLIVDDTARVRCP